MGESGADLGPLLLGFAVGLVLFDGEDVEVGECRALRVQGLGGFVDCDCSFQYS
jgi:hypothetical protein